MEKQIMYELGLHLWTEQQLFLLICFICHIELIVLLIVMWKKKFFIEIWDGVLLSLSIIMLSYTLFRIEHVTFFFSIFYINCFLLFIYLICSQYKKTW